MKSFLIMSFLVVVLFVLTLGQGVKAQIVSGPPIATNKLPDLIVSEIVFEKSGRTKIRVRVLNKGTAASSTCHLALMSQIGDDASITTKQRVWTIEFPALEPGKGLSQVINVLPLTQAHGSWKAVIDRSNVVKESNESNNQLEQAYPGISFGGAVNVPMPDLQITNAVLTDATTGEVTVEISNTGEGPAKISKLRLIVWEMGQFERKPARQVFVKVSAINALQKTTVKITAGAPIISAKYSLFIDIGNEVTEKSEKNNRFEGEAGKS